MIIECDKAAWIDEKLETVDAALTGGSIHAVHDIVKALRPHGKFCSNGIRLHDSDGVPASDKHAEKEIVKSHFALQLSGRPCNFSTLLDRDKFSPAPSVLSTLPLVDDDVLAEVPSLYELSAVYHEAPANKQYGENRMSGKLTKVFNHAFAVLYYPVLLKSTVRVSYPLQWKGGLLSELFKNKGLRHLIDNYRDIFLGDFNGKAAFKILRRVLIPLCVGIVGHSQYGSGFNGGETAFAHLHLRLFSDYAAHHNVSSSILFVDVLVAFASLLRRILFDTGQGDEAWYRQLSDTGYTSQQIHSIINKLSTFHSYYNGASPIPPLKMALWQSEYTNTWFSCEFTDGIIATSKGCMAGMTLADITYALAFSKVLDTLYKSLNDQNLVSYYTSDFDAKSHPCRLVAYHDDIFIFNMAAKPSLIVYKTTSVALYVRHTFMIFGLTVNFKEGKSEATIQFRGTSQKIEHRRLQDMQYSVPIDPVDASSPVLRFVPLYKHMGTKTCLGSEVAHRCAIVCTACKSFSHIFKNELVSDSKKVSVVRAYLVSKGAHNCSTWPALPPHLSAKFHHAIMSVYRKALGLTVSAANAHLPIVPDDEIISEYGIVAPLNLIRCARMQLFVRILMKSPTDLLEILLSTIDYCPKKRSSNPWSAEVLNDFKILALHDRRFSGSLRDIIVNLPSIPNPSRIVRRLMYNEFANLDVPNASVKPPRHLIPMNCYLCDKVFPSFQQLSLHQFKAHGIKNLVRRYVDGVHCTVCLLYFHTRERLINHISRRSKVCKAVILSSPPIIDEQQSLALDEAEKSDNRKLYSTGMRRHTAKSPAFRLPGPINKVHPLRAPTYSPHHPLGLGRNLYNTPA